MQNSIQLGELKVETNHLEKLSNEFAMVRFGKVILGNGERLLIEVPASGKQVLLDPILLEALVSLSHEELSQLLAATKE